MRYRRLASPLHAARAAAGAAYCGALVAAVLATRHPLLLAALGVAVVGAGAGAGATEPLRRAARLAVPLALLVALINPLVVRDGLTVFAQLGEVGAFGQVDLTVEALVYGGLEGLRVLLVVLVCALFTACVDPDELLRLLRRVSYRSALTAVLAVRLVPVLARDARRLEDARRCRPDAGGPSGPAARIAVLRAVTAGALDRAIDVAATLEVRGYGAPEGERRLTSTPATSDGAQRGLREPLSRHDRAFLAAALVLLAATAAAVVFGVARFQAYPRLAVELGAGELGVALVLAGAALAPFLDRRGIER